MSKAFSAASFSNLASSSAFLFSNIGTYFIGAILILVGALLVSPWSVYDIAEFFSRGFAKWREGHERRKEERFVKQEEKARQKAEEEGNTNQASSSKTGRSKTSQISHNLSHGSF